jgi:hypothetical protein
MAIAPIGYQRLITQHQLPAVPLAQVAQIDMRVTRFSFAVLSRDNCNGLRAVSYFPR